jgi:hypothetical protein
MDFYKRDFFIARIQAGFIPVTFKGVDFEIHHPDTVINLRANALYVQCYEEALEEGLMTDDDILPFIISQGIWSKKMEDEYQRIAPKHIEYFKKELYKAVLKTKTRDQVRKYLEAAKKEYNRLGKIRRHYDYVTVDGYANFAKNMFLIQECTLLNGEKVDWSQYSLVGIMGQYHQSLLNVADIRELAHTMPWANMWSCLKVNGKIFNTELLTVEQQSLISWSNMYDRIHESPDCPSDDVINDDDMLDGWLLIQKEKREAEKKREEVQGAVSQKIANSDEIIVPVQTVEDAQKLDLLNPPQVQAIKRNRMKQIKRQGTVKQQEFKDVQQKRSMQMQKAFNEQVKGR